MKISIVGAGSVGRALGAGFARAGHAVRFAVRNPAAYRPGATPQIAAKMAALGSCLPAAFARLMLSKLE